MIFIEQWFTEAMLKILLSLWKFQYWVIYSVNKCYEIFMYLSIPISTKMYYSWLHEEVCEDCDDVSDVSLEEDLEQDLEELLDFDEPWDDNGNLDLADLHLLETLEL